MENTRVGEGQEKPEMAEFVQGVLRAASHDQLSELFQGDHPEALYYFLNRNGVSTIGIRTCDLIEEQIDKILRYRLAQYLAVGYVNVQVLLESHLEHEPRSNLIPEDIHFIAGSAETGEILCYCVIRAFRGARPGTTLRMMNRNLLDVEEIYGWGIYNHLPILPDLPIEKVRELGRFVKNQRLPKFDELGTRATIEMMAAIAHSLTGPDKPEVEAFVGMMEEGVAKRDLEFFHTPLVMLDNGVPHVEEDHYFYPYFQNRKNYPFAFLTSDLGEARRSRWPKIEKALELPGKQALFALMELKQDIHPPKSSLMAPEGLLPVIGINTARQKVRMQAP